MVNPAEWETSHVACQLSKHDESRSVLGDSGRQCDKIYVDELGKNYAVVLKEIGSRVDLRLR